MYTSVHSSIHGIMCVNMRSISMSWCVCIHMWSMFLAKHGFQPCVVHGTLAQSGAQIINTLFSIHISFSIIVEEVEHVIGTLDDEA